VIPGGYVYQQLWMQDNGHDLLRRSISELPFTNTTPLVTRVYPAELTEEFAGAAGVGYPGAGRNATFSVNTFDDLGYWTGQYPIAVGDSDQSSNVTMLLADSVIVFSVTADFRGVGLAQQVRKLSPH